jgi:hypothetical protein
LTTFPCTACSPACALSEFARAPRCAYTSLTSANATRLVWNDLSKLHHPTTLGKKSPNSLLCRKDLLYCHQDTFIFTPHAPQTPIFFAIVRVLVQSQCRPATSICIPENQDLELTCGYESERSDRSRWYMCASRVKARTLERWLICGKNCKTPRESEALDGADDRVRSPVAPSTCGES